jgi:quercetin dioxygenase-like cupin family protein
MPGHIGWELKPADASTFTGSVETVLLAGSSDGEALKLFYVRFSAGARTHWHRHAGVQTLLVTEGRCLVQREHHPVMELAAGQTVTIPPHERHWHGAGPTEPGAHIAINMDNRETTWFEPVSGEDYAS